MISFASLDFFFCVSLLDRSSHVAIMLTCVERLIMYVAHLIIVSANNSVFKVHCVWQWNTQDGIQIDSWERLQPLCNWWMNYTFLSYYRDFKGGKSCASQIFTSSHCWHVWFLPNSSLIRKGPLWSVPFIVYLDIFAITRHQRIKWKNTLIIWEDNRFFLKMFCGLKSIWPRLSGCVVVMCHWVSVQPQQQLCLHCWQ